MARQHSKPYIVRDSTARALEGAEYHFDEAWLRDFIFAHQQVLPINEIEPVFDLLIPVCTELRTNAGPAEILFINDAGLLSWLNVSFGRTLRPEERSSGKYWIMLKNSADGVLTIYRKLLRRGSGKSFTT